MYVGVEMYVVIEMYVGIEMYVDIVDVRRFCRYTGM
jgi:hypothetical protein